MSVLRPAVARSHAPAILLVTATLLVACGADSGTPPAAEADAAGWVPIAEGDTFGEWELSVQVEDDTWTGCLRLVHVDGTVEKCTAPGDAVVLANDVVDVGATPTGQALAFEDGRGEVATYGGELDLGFEFFVTATGLVDAETGQPVEVVGTRAGLGEVTDAFVGRWTSSTDVVCTDGAPGVDPSEIASLEITPEVVIVTSPCAGPDPAATATCRAGYLLIGGASDGDAVEVTLAPTGTDCGGDGVWLTELGLRVDGDRLVVDDSATFDLG